MCGIFGAISLEGGFSNNEIEKHEASLQRVSYRGPDDQSHKILNDSRVFLGHRRLSIIDLSAEANQPMQADGNWIVFNGEIFNYLEIRSELVARGCHFTTQSDTEVILKTYETFGIDGFDKFNGMWAFLLYDSKRNLFIASRDRFSIKPLYYAKVNSKYYFASEIKQLLTYQSVRRPNIETIRTFLAQRIQDHNLETFYEGIYKIPAKSSLLIDLNARTEKFVKYWDFSTKETGLDVESTFEEFRYLFEQSVKIRLRSDVPIGCLLSGGLDSTAIAVVANAINSNPIQTFSVISDDPKTSEERFIDIVRAGGIQNTKMPFQFNASDSNVDLCLEHQDEPFSGLSVVAQYMIYKLIADQTKIKVVLSGQGGDEALMGYLKYYFFILKNDVRRHDYLSFSRAVFDSLVRRTAILQFDWAVAKKYLPNNGGNALVNKEGRALEQIWDFKTLNDRQKSDIDRYSVPALTHFEDRNSMANSIESRVPFLDHKLVDFLVNLPTRLKYKNGWSKYILRKAIDMPAEIKWRRDKRGFTVPERRWLERKKSEILKFDEYSKLADLGILKPTAVKNEFERFFSGNGNLDPKEVFSIYMTKTWLNRQF